MSRGKAFGGVQGRSPWLDTARARAAAGKDEPAKQAYLEALKHDPTNRDALVELATLAVASHHLTAARTAFAQALRFHAHDPVAHTGLADLLTDDANAARAHYQAALAADPDYAHAHAGLARLLADEGEHKAAEPHWRRGFTGRSLVRRRFRGAGAGVPLLLLAAARGGNIPTRHLIDDRHYAVTAIYADFHDPDAALPTHALLVNAVGDADLCADALKRAERIAARSDAPVINPPARVALTGRAQVASRLATIQGVVTPDVATVSRADLLRHADRAYPLLLRAPGFHTGRHFVRVDRADMLAGAVAALPGDPLLAIEFLDARGPDGLVRKYRVMFVDGRPYPLHLAVSPDWKVHYVTAATATDPRLREEERQFLGDMPRVLGPRASAALGAIAQVLSLDYAGADFGLSASGEILLFEANATMVVNPPEPGPLDDYRRPAAEAILTAVRRMLRDRAEARTGV